jgi:hypothetical protein
LPLLTWVAVAADFSHTATFALLYMIVIVIVTTGNSAAGIGWRIHRRPPLELLFHRVALQFGSTPQKT